MRTLALVLVLLAAAAPAAHAADPGVVPDLNWGTSPAEQDRTAGALRAAGVKWVRLHVQWSYWEPDGPSVALPWTGSLKDTDRSVQLARAAGAKVLIMVYNAPRWAAVESSEEGAVPRDAADYARFIRNLAAHYRGQVDAYEIWNEMDLERFWSTGADPARYAALLRAAYPAVKEGDPAARVVFGGLSWDYTRERSFLARAYAAGAKGSFDVLGLHAYPDPVRDPTLEEWQGWYRTARRTMLAFGDDKPIWLTEFGFNTSRRAYDPSAGAWQAGVSEDVQASLLTRALTLLDRDPFVEAAFYYNFRNNYWNRDDARSVEGSFGLLRTDFSPKPGYFAFRDYAHRPPSPPSAPSAPPENAAPTVRLLAPGAGARVPARPLRLSAAAQDDRRVAKVEFRVDGRTVAVDAQPPFTATWDARRAAPGRYGVTVVAYDADGLSASASAVVVKPRAIMQKDRRGRAGARR